MTSTHTPTQQLLNHHSRHKVTIWPHVCRCLRTRAKYEHSMACMCGRALELLLGERSSTRLHGLSESSSLALHALHAIATQSIEFSAFGKTNQHLATATLTFSAALSLISVVSARGHTRRDRCAENAASLLASVPPKRVQSHTRLVSTRRNKNPNKRKFKS
jgi:hypothetical protein